MRKVFAVILMTVMLLSGCGAVKNLENPGSRPNPKVYGAISFGHRYYKEEAGEVVCHYGAGLLVAFCYVLGRYIIPYYCPLEGGQEWFNKEIFNKPKSKEIRWRIPRGAQDLPHLEIGND
jgi:uncharacterized protein YceK